MSAKTDTDKLKPNYPWTARQRRMKTSNRNTRKKNRTKARNI